MVRFPPTIHIRRDDHVQGRWRTRDPRAVPDERGRGLSGERDAKRSVMRGEDFPRCVHRYGPVAERYPLLEARGIQTEGPGFSSRAGLFNLIDLVDLIKPCRLPPHPQNVRHEPHHTRTPQYPARFVSKSRVFVVPAFASLQKTCEPHSPGDQDCRSTSARVPTNFTVSCASMYSTIL